MGQGYAARLAVGANPVTFGGATLSFDFVSYTVQTDGEHIDTAGITGKRTKREDRKRSGIIRLAGSLVLEPSMHTLDFFLPYILGATEAATDTFRVANTLPVFDALLDHGEGSDTAVKHVGLVVNRAVFSLRPGLVRLTLDLIGKTETLTTYTSAAIVAGVEYTPLIFHDAVLNIQGAPRAIDDAELVIDNQLEVKFRNSQTAQLIVPTDRIVSLQTSHPATEAVMDALYSDPAAASASIVFTRGVTLCTINLYNLSAPLSGPIVNGKGETTLGVSSRARGDNTNEDIMVVNDPTVAV